MNLAVLIGLALYGYMDWSIDRKLGYPPPPPSARGPSVCCRPARTPRGPPQRVILGFWGARLFLEICVVLLKKNGVPPPPPFWREGALCMLQASQYYTMLHNIKPKLHRITPNKRENTILICPPKIILYGLSVLQRRVNSTDEIGRGVMKRRASVWNGYIYMCIERYIDLSMYVHITDIYIYMYTYIYRANA